MRPGFLENIIQVERYAGQVTEVLQQRKQRKEDRHRWKHHAHHPGSRQVHAIDQQSAQPPGHANHRSQFQQRRVDVADQ
jgi:hypothetical protein